MAMDKFTIMENDKWYLLKGNLREKKHFIDILLGNGWRFANTMPYKTPDLIKLTIKNDTDKLIHYRSIYNECFMGPVLNLDVAEALDKIARSEIKSQNKEVEMNICDKPNQILELSYQKELDKLEEDTQTAIHNIKMDNPYVVAINSAINKTNKVTGLKVTMDSINLYIDNLLSVEEKVMIEKVLEVRAQNLKKLQEKYQVAETLLKMADTYEQKEHILINYTKNVL